jgi:hypothetical protein
MKKILLVKWTENQQFLDQEMAIFETNYISKKCNRLRQNEVGKHAHREEFGKLVCNALNKDLEKEFGARLANQIKLLELINGNYFTQAALLNELKEETARYTPPVPVE